MHHSTLNFLPKSSGILHFVGIGGIGMSGIAELLYNLGYQVQGSDMSNNPNCQRLAKLGIQIFTGHDPKYVQHASYVIKSTAIGDDNCELKEARALNIPVVRRCEMLAELLRLKASVAVAGSHGKTTTTSLVSHLFEQGNYAPTVINGGIINRYGSNTRLGDGQWMVAEADESDGTFVRIPATIGIITNIDPEHLDYYGSFDALKNAFCTFISQLPFYGFGVLNHDHEVVSEIRQRIYERTIYTYSVVGNQQADLWAENIEIIPGGCVFDVRLSDILAKKWDKGRNGLSSITLPMLGMHNLSNALAALTVGVGLGFDPETCLHAFEGFEGVKRRFTYVGRTDNPECIIIDDYAHHPKEIEATLQTARQFQKSDPFINRVIAVWQPHRYSRVEEHKKAFLESLSVADQICITPIYAAGETPRPGCGQEELLAEASCLCDLPVLAVNDPSTQGLYNALVPHLREGDLVVCMGAGSISAWANDLPTLMQKEEYNMGLV